MDYTISTDTMMIIGLLILVIALFKNQPQIQAWLLLPISALIMLKDANTAFIAFTITIINLIRVYIK